VGANVHAAQEHRGLAGARANDRTTPTTGHPERDGSGSPWREWESRTHSPAVLALAGLRVPFRVPLSTRRRGCLEPGRRRRRRRRGRSNATEHGRPATQTASSALAQRPPPRPIRRPGSARQPKQRVGGYRPGQGQPLSGVWTHTAAALRPRHQNSPSGKNTGEARTLTRTGPTSAGPTRQPNRRQEDSTVPRSGRCVLV
jgi:hypothetical protein